MFRVRLRLVDAVPGWRIARLMQHAPLGTAPTDPRVRFVRDREFADYEVKRDGKLKAVYID